ncbi:MAG: hypothetical protein AAGE98_18140 [Actinomycetota bacterium]
MLRAALGLLETATEPVIEDYPIEADAPGPEPWACPLNLAVDPDESLAGRVRAEVARLRPWAAETRRVRGRTLFGLSGADPDQVDDVVEALISIVTSGDVDATPTDTVDWAHPMPFLVRHLADDLRSFYHEAIAAQPGETPPDHDALNDWIFGQTAFGELLIELGDALTTAEDTSPFAALVRGLTIPEGRYRGRGGFEGIAGHTGG